MMAAQKHSSKKSLQFSLIQNLSLNESRSLGDLSINALIAYQRWDIVDLPLRPVDVLELFPPGDELTQCPNILQLRFTPGSGYILCLLSHRDKSYSWRIGRCKRGIDMRQRGANIRAPRLLGDGFVSGDEREE